MSDSHARKEEWRPFIADMISFCEKVLVYTEGLTQDEFVTDERTYDAVLRNMELLGEAATHVPTTVRESHGDIPWRLITGMRNRLIHGYLGIDNDVVWSTVQDDVPALAKALRLVLASAGAQNR